MSIWNRAVPSLATQQTTAHSAHAADPKRTLKGTAPNGNNSRRRHRGLVRVLGYELPEDEFGGVLDPEREPPLPDPLPPALPGPPEPPVLEPLVPDPPLPALPEPELGVLELAGVRGVLELELELEPAAPVLPVLPVPLAPALGLLGGLGEDDAVEDGLAKEALVEAGDGPLLGAVVELLPEPTGFGEAGVVGREELVLGSGAVAARCKRSAFSSALSEILSHA